MITVNSDNFDLKKIADSGQCFRMVMCEPDKARVAAAGKLLYIVNRGSGNFEFSCTEKEYADYWYDYFDLGTDYAVYKASVDPKDVFLTKAAEYGTGIRILKQEKFETLISFIISQRKNIPAIQSSVERLCRTCGRRIEDGIYAFPEPEALASLSDRELSACSLGYRTQYVREAAIRVASGEKDLEALNGLSDDELFSELISFYGVGRKVANCVMLFAYHRIGAFPEDVWIKRIEDGHYNGRFPVEKYPGFAGIMQQYMFFYSRETAGKP